MRRSASFAAPLRESFFDLAQRYHKLRESAFRSKGTKKIAVPPVVVTRERRLTDLPPPLPPADASVADRLYDDNDIDEAPEEATLVQPLSRAPSEAPPPPPASERRAYATTMRPPPPPDPLPRLVAARVPSVRPSAMPPSTMPSSYPQMAVAATLPPGPPPAAPGIWRPMLAAAALSATIGACVSVGIWSMRTPPSSMKPAVAAVAAPTKVDTAQASLAPCPIPSSLTNGGSASAVERTSAPAPTQVSVDALPVETTSPRTVTEPVLRAPGRSLALARASTSRAVSTPFRVIDAPAPVAAPRPAAAEAERPSKRSRKSTHGDAPADTEASAETEASVGAASPPPVPTAGPDRAAISKAIARAFSSATTCDSGPQSGRAQITFAPSGNVASVQLLQPFRDNSVNGCVLRALGRAHVPPFAGEPVTVRKALNW